MLPISARTGHNLGRLVSLLSEFRTTLQHSGELELARQRQRERITRVTMEVCVCV